MTPTDNAGVTGEAMAVQMVVVGKLIVDEFEVAGVEVKDTVDGQVGLKQLVERLGGGSTQAAFGGRVWGKSVGLVAPAGEDFPPHMEAYLMSMGVDVQGVARLEGFKTPRELIRCDQLLFTAKVP
ncbi:unnamed protein product [Choristocarpus tenellus]